MISDNNSLNLYLFLRLCCPYPWNKGAVILPSIEDAAAGLGSGCRQKVGRVWVADITPIFQNDLLAKSCLFDMSLSVHWWWVCWSWGLLSKLSEKVHTAFKLESSNNVVITPLILVPGKVWVLATSSSHLKEPSNALFCSAGALLVLVVYVLCWFFEKCKEQNLTSNDLWWPNLKITEAVLLLLRYLVLFRISLFTCRYMAQELI